METLIDSVRRQSAGTMSPILKEIMSPGTRSEDSISRQDPERFTLALGARESMRAFTAFPAFRSS